MPVARIGESVSYSDKLREQANLINQRRQQNLNVELAQEDRNRAFREKQIADTYSFDTTGINPAFLPAISGLQAKISGHLDPKSSEVYESKEDLIKDTNTLRSIYNVAKSNTEIGQKSADTYRGYLDGSVTLPDGQAFAGNKEVYDERYRAYEKGGLDDIQIEGSAGNYTITGFELVESDLGDGSFVPSEERVNVLSSVSAIDPSYLFRPEVVKDSYLIPAENYLKYNNVENALSQASRDFDPKAASIQQPYRVSLAEAQPNEGWLDVAENDVTDENGNVTTKKGDYLRGQSELKESYLKEIEEFWNDNYQVDMSSSKISSGSVSVEVNGTSVNAYQILDPKTKKPVKPEVGLPNAGSVNVSYVNASGEGDDTVLTMVYEMDGELQSETVGVSTGAGRSLITQIGGESGLVDLISRQTDLKGASNVNEGTVKEGVKGDGEGGKEGDGEDVVQASTEPAVNPIDNYKSAINSLLQTNPLTGTTSGSGDFLRSDLGKFANRIKDMSIAQQTTEVNKEIRRLRGVQSQAVERNPKSYLKGDDGLPIAPSQIWKNADKALKKLEEVQSMQEGLDTPENRDIAIEDIRTRIDEKKQELIESENISDRNSKNKTRDRINQEIIELEQGLEGLDLFANRESSSADADLAVDPPTNPLPLLKAAPQNDWYNFSNISDKITEDQRSLIGYLVEDHGITPQAAVALTSVTAKESSGEAGKKEGSYYATGKRPDGTEMNNLEQIKGIFKSSMGDNAPNPLTQAELDEARAEGKEYFDNWFFDRVYGADTEIGRGLGNTEPGDGHKFRGRGLIQFTGRKNYSDASEFLFGDPDVLTNNPELLAEDPILGARAAAWYLMRNGQIKNSALAAQENLSREDALALADSSYALVAGESAFTPRKILQKRKLYPSGSAGQRAWLNIN